METQNRSSFSGSLGFVLAAAGSAVGLGNIWRFPYLTARYGGGLFLVVYLILAVTFGFTLLATEIAIGRKTAQGPLTAYGKLCKPFGFAGFIAWLVPAIILPYYCAIGGWVLKYFIAYISGSGMSMAEDGAFTGFITSQWTPLIFMLVFFALTFGIVFAGVEKGIEKFSKVLMPILIVLIIGIAIFTLTISHTDEDGSVRTGMQGLAVYLIPSFEGVTFSYMLELVMAAMGQMFFSLSIAMGIMIAYGSYMPKEANINKSINHITIFDTLIAVLAGMVVIPALYVFMGKDSLSASGPSLLFVSLPKVLQAMGVAGNFVGVLFFLSVIFAALTSSISIMEAIVAGLMDHFKLSRKVSCCVVGAVSLVLATIVCLGYNVFYFDLTLPNGSVGQILDVFDYLSNNCLMPIGALLTCIMVGWVVKPKTVIDEIEHGCEKFGRKGLYTVMIRYIAPILLVILLISSIGIF